MLVLFMKTAAVGCREVLWRAVEEESRCAGRVRGHFEPPLASRQDVRDGLVE